jgi:hypothetical protein
MASSAKGENEMKLASISALFSIVFFFSTTAFALNPIQVENAKVGTTAWQLSAPATNREIEGYASLTSVNKGGTIDLYVNTIDPSFNINVYRMGWYNGEGAREVLALTGLPGTVQVMPTPIPGTFLVEAQWVNPVTLTTTNPSDPSDWTSGIYLAKLTGSGGKESYIIFVVRDDTRPSDLLFQSSVTTYQAYNTWGGYSLYTTPQAQKVSFNRPYASTDPLGISGLGAGDFLTNNTGIGYPASKAAWEINMLRFLEREGYDVTYATNVDTHESVSPILKRKAFLSVGHDEYWSYQMRTNVEAARNQGINLGFFSSNTCYWQIRLESDALDRPNRTIVAYKEDALTADPYATDRNRKNDYLITTRWRDRPVRRPEDALLGVLYVDDGVNGDIVVYDATQWPFAGTGLVNGARLPGLLGYEVDARGRATPPGTVLLARSPYTSAWATSGYSEMVTYEAASGATVFATGSMQWAWGLDDYNAPALRPSVLNSAAQQITRNVLARLIGVQ